MTLSEEAEIPRPEGICRGAPTDEVLPGGAFRAVPCRRESTRFGLLCEGCWLLLSDTGRGKITDLFIRDPDPNHLLPSLHDARQSGAAVITVLDRWRQFQRK